MSASADPSDPRWGSENRPRKAEAIWQTLVHYCGPQIAQGLWVDVGCGSGGIAATLASRVERMVGMDPEPWERWNGWAREHSNLTFLQGGYDSEPPIMVPGSADVVVCNQVYEHVPDPVALVRFVHLILRPGGHCYFAGPNLLFPIEPHVFWPFVHWLPRHTATWLMRSFRARNIVDANSLCYWQLMKLFEGFEVRNALPHLLQHPEASGRGGLFWQAASMFPARLINALTFLSPGFVFILRKQAAD
jgi:2-polyprenyl-3-methyl-5-hydroxy-6-metoxy-1,4-benzoquinol methylase